MVIHSTLTGADNHDPRGVNSDPLILADDTVNVLLWEDSNADPYFAISTSNGFEVLSFGNGTTNPDLELLGDGEIRGVAFTVRELAASPSATASQGKLHGLDVSGETELHYVSSDGTVTQLTGAGAGGGGVTLDGAYDFGGAHLGRQINVDSGFPVQLTAGASTDVALSVTGEIAFTTTNTVVGGGTHNTPGTNASLYGSDSKATGSSGVAIGYAANCTALDGIAFGTQSTAGSGARAMAFGRLAVATYADSIAFGRSSAATATNQILFGNPSYYYTELVLGGGDTDGNARTLTVRPSNATGTNTGGWRLDLQAGLGTGTGAGGVAALRTSVPGTTGSSLNSAFDAVGVDPSTTGAAPNGEAFIASNTTTDPRRYSSGATSVSTVSGGTHSIVDLSQYTNSTSQMGWIRVQVTVLVSGSTDCSTYFLANAFVLDSAGTMTLGTAVKYATAIDIGTGALSDADITASTQTLEVDWTASTSDNYDVSWFAEWGFGPCPNVV